MIQAQPPSDQVLSFFSGAGGFSYGFAQAGLKPACGADMDRDACASYEANVGGTCHHLDLALADPSFFRAVLQGKSPFAVIGGPPCQGFSTAGARAGKDPRNQLIINYFSIVERLQPRWFIFENVEGLLTSGHGSAVSSLVHAFLQSGYSVRLHKVNLAAYGVPQTRKRVFIIGNRMGIDFDFPPETCSFDSGKSKKQSGKPFAPSLAEAIAGLGAASSVRGQAVCYGAAAPLNAFDGLMRAGNSAGTVSEHFHTASAQDAARYALLKPGQTMKDLPQEFWHESFRRRAFRRVMDGTPTEKRGGAPSGIKRLHGHLQSLTITGAASREFIHPDAQRPLTMRECARIQTFPDRYVFTGNAASVMQQIGNAVPPMAAAVFAQHLQRLDGRFGSGLQVHEPAQKPRLLGFLLTESSGMSQALQTTDSLLRGLQQRQTELEFA
jgi:DNA (cytosine-5)-methyltransferase 1